MRNEKYAMQPLFMAELLKFPRLKNRGFGVEEHDGRFKMEVEIWPFRACAMYPAIVVGTVR